jgi:hypothetical protein
MNCRPQTTSSTTFPNVVVGERLTIERLERVIEPRRKPENRHERRRRLSQAKRRR